MLPTNCWLPMLTSNFDHQSWLPILTTNFDYQCRLPKRSLQRSIEGKGRVSMNHMKALQNNQRIDAAVNRHSFNCVLPFKRNNCQILQKSLQFISKSSKNHYKHAFFTVVRLRWSIYAYKKVLQGIKNHRTSSEIIAKPSENYIIIKQAMIRVVRLWRKISKSSRESENHQQIIGSHCKIIQKLLLTTSNPAYCMFQREHSPASHRGSRRIIALTLVRACCHMLLLEDTNEQSMKTCKL